jgi:hypothetical protein
MQRDWKGRYDSPRNWASRLDKVSRQLGQQFEKPIDEEATADREAVVHFIRKGVGKNPPNRNRLPNNIASMSNADYARFLKETFNINSRVS